jgi:hypothetical protein
LFPDNNLRKITAAAKIFDFALDGGVVFGNSSWIAVASPAIALA